MGACGVCRIMRDGMWRMEDGARTKRRGWEGGGRVRRDPRRWYEHVTTKGRKLEGETGEICDQPPLYCRQCGEYRHEQMVIS